MKNVQEKLMSNKKCASNVLPISNENCASNVQPISNEKCASKVQPISNVNEENRGTYIWRGVEENAKEYIRMLKQHVLPMNPCVRISLSSKQSSGAQHSYLPCPISVRVGATSDSKHLRKRASVYFLP
jgi:hypothetical protein